MVAETKTDRIDLSSMGVPPTAKRVTLECKIIPPSTVLFKASPASEPVEVTDAGRITIELVEQQAIYVCKSDDVTDFHVGVLGYETD